VIYDEMPGRTDLSLGFDYARLGHQGGKQLRFERSASLSEATPEGGLAVA
jgi:hypothetical protein